MDFFVVLNDAFYKKNNETGVYYDELDLLYKTKGKAEAKAFITNDSKKKNIDRTITLALFNSHPNRTPAYLAVTHTKTLVIAGK